jgi:hypothetical protein
MRTLLAAPAGLDRWFGWGYALAAYIVIFASFFGYVGYLHVSHRRLRRRLEELQRQLRQRGET